MGEGKTVAISIIILIIIGVLAIYLPLFVFTGFNFDKSEITISGNNIQEKLTYTPNKPYHTLYRNFVTPISIADISSENMQMTSVTCTSGTSYVYTSTKSFYTFNKDFKEQHTLPHTEPNEYGCTFGDTLGFSKGQDYVIQSSYIINNKNLFQINNQYYTKFVVYSPNSHKLLIKNKNFFTSGDKDIITKNLFLPNQYVIIYIPYKGSDISNYTIIKKSNFEFNSSYLFFILPFLPAFLFFIVWFLFGRENNPLDVPKELSTYPNERKAWEVAAIFNPPFGQINKNFFPAMVLDMCRNKIIDLKTKDKDNLIKINPYKNKKLDEVETAFIKYLETIIKLADKKHIDSSGYINIEKAIKSITGSFFGYKNKLELQKAYRSFSELVREQSKKYIDIKGQVLMFISAFILLIFSFISAAFANFSAYLSIFVSFAIIIIITFSSSTFIKFKGDYYQEYQKWQAFKRYLKSFSSMRTCPPEAVKLWEQRLVYATGLGVGYIVIKKFKEWKIITEKQYNTYHGVYTSSAIGATASSSGGGMGGAGGGGAGGGGGGGR